MRTTNTLSARLLRWYRANGRRLPWRETDDPYAVLVSEFMLQQTTVETVIPYFERWMRLFPDISTLAAADRDAVMKAWEGLGYYTRAVSLHKSAGLLANRRIGDWPATEEAWRVLPGVGPYTAAALAAFVNHRRAVALDGPVRRVFYRFFRLDAKTSSSKNDEIIRGLGLALISKTHPGDSMQALMDLAALVCRRSTPECATCPLNSDCDAHRRGDSSRLTPRKTPTRERIDVAVGIWLRRGAVYLQRRPESGLFAGLWELPGGKVEAGESPDAAVIREFREELNRTVEIAGDLPMVRHSYTRFDVTIHPFVVYGQGPAPKASGGGLFVPLEQVGAYAQPAANAKIWGAFRTWLDL